MLLLPRYAVGLKGPQVIGLGSEDIRCVEVHGDDMVAAGRCEHVGYQPRAL